jgi:hypothetical protein
LVARGSWKVVSESEWRGRQHNARAFLKAAEDLLEMAEESSIGNPIITQVIDSAIAFADAVTIKFAQIQNVVDHRGLPKTLKAAIGGRFPREQEQRLTRLLSWKDDAHYGHRAASLDEAKSVKLQADRFAEWAEAELARP